MSQADVQSSSAAILKAITYRISSTPVKQLPNIAPQCAGLIWKCKSIFFSTTATTNQGSDTGLIVHRFKTHLSALLQDRTIEGRWSAVVLIKATIEAGGVEIVSKSNVWIRGLLAILKKPGPPTTRNLAIITLTRIFTVTWDYSNLIREITTPALPAFIANCLSNVENSHCSSNELQNVLEAFAALIPKHPATFRSNESQIHKLLVKIISSTSPESGAEFYYSQAHLEAAQNLLIGLHHCCPKQGSAEKWDETFRAVVAAAHATSDQMLRSVDEDRQTPPGRQPLSIPRALHSGGVELEQDEPLGLSGWKGVDAGSQRLVVLLGMLRACFKSATIGPVNIRVGLVSSLLSRLLSIAVPRSGKLDFTKANPQISREEREEMFMVLPEIHRAAMECAGSMIGRFGHALSSVIQPLLVQILWIFEAEKNDLKIRQVTYDFLTTILDLQGPGLSNDDIKDLEKVIIACCEDLLAAGDRVSPAQSSALSGKQTVSNRNLGIYTPLSTRTAPLTSFNPLYEAANELLPLLLARLDPACIAGSVRNQLERTAIFIQHREALVASVLNPSVTSTRGSVQTSLLPLLARQHSACAEVEALLRPRMPMISAEKTTHDVGNIDSEDEMMANDHTTDDNISSRYDDEEPTSGLLSALNEKITVAFEHTPSEHHDSAEALTLANTDKLYATKPIFPGFPVATKQILEKRNASPPRDHSPKRLRTSLNVESPSYATATPHTSTFIDSETERPSTVAAEQPPNPGRSSASSPHQLSLNVSASQGVASYSTETGVDVPSLASDESDFEMPPLTLELDTEPEDEGEGDGTE